MRQNRPDHPTPIPKPSMPNPRPQEPLRTLPGFISQILMAKVAIDRISSLLTAPERARQPNDHGSVVYGTTDSYKRDSFPSVLPTAPEIEQRQRDDGGRRRRDGVEGEIAVSFQGLDLSWSDDSSTPPTLRYNPILPNLLSAFPSARIPWLSLAHFPRVFPSVAHCCA